MNSTSRPQIAIPAVYMRGGTSRAIIFHAKDLPLLDDRPDREAWDRIFLAALGSPDPGGRQLDGLGGGISSLSKVAVVSRSSRDGADVDYTFAQVSVSGTSVGYRGNCGNISSAIGPFAVDEGLVTAHGDHATVNIYNTNTGKIIRATFPLVDGRAAVRGDFVIQGVAGSGAEIRLDFMDPGGAVTGRLLPTGNVIDRIDLPGGHLDVSLIDAANPVVFFRAESIGLTGTETPDAIAGDADLMSRLESIRIAASLRMGISTTVEEARTTTSSVPFTAIVSKGNKAADVTIRVISAGQPHKAIPLTVAMCVAIAAKLENSLVASVAARGFSESESVSIAHASGVIPVTASVFGSGQSAFAESATVFRTARRLMEGRVLIPGFSR